MWIQVLVVVLVVLTNGAVAHIILDHAGGPFWLCTGSRIGVSFLIIFVTVTMNIIIFLGNVRILEKCPSVTVCKVVCEPFFYQLVSSSVPPRHNYVYCCISPLHLKKFFQQAAASFPAPLVVSSLPFLITFPPSSFLSRTQSSFHMRVP